MSRRSIFPMNGVLSPDSSARVSKAPESRWKKLKNSILAVLGRPNNLDTASQVIDVPIAQLEELREGSQGVEVEFPPRLAPFAMEHHPRRGIPHLPRNRILGVELVHQKVGPRRRQVARLGRTASTGTAKASKQNMVAMVAPWPRRRQSVCALHPCPCNLIWIGDSVNLE